MLDWVREGDVVRVQIDNDANVLLLDDPGFSAYLRHLPFNYVGGAFAPGAHLLSVRKAGRWHVVIDLGGRQGQLTHSVGVTHHDAPGAKRG
jgi:hypothetical protein